MRGSHAKRMNPLDVIFKMCTNQCQCFNYALVYFYHRTRSKDNIQYNIQDRTTLYTKSSQTDALGMNKQKLANMILSLNQH